jgi:hypothetical protein
VLNVVLYYVMVPVQNTEFTEPVFQNGLDGLIVDKAERIPRHRAY